MTEKEPTDNDFDQWLGNSQSFSDILIASPANSLAATLNRKETEFRQGDPLPCLWHWLYFLKADRLDQLELDGHPKKGSFLPPLSLPRRMWAGSRLTFIQPLQVGDVVTKKSTIQSIQFKTGRSGKLAFVCVAHELSNTDGVAIVEEQDLVFRGAASPSASPTSPVVSSDVADYSRVVKPSSVLLFRYSALTLNSHRIHYDREYAQDVEGYPALVVHGPLLATLMMELVVGELAGRLVLSFEFRVMQPVLDDGEFRVCGLKPNGDDKCLVWVENSLGEVCMRGLVGLGGV